MILSGAIQDETKNFNGKKWTQVSKMRLEKIYPFQNLWIGINSDGGLYFSKNNGKTWSFETGNDNAQATSIAIMKERIAIAATQTGLKQTTDGITWVDITDSLIQGTNCSAIACGENGLWVTSNENGNYYTITVDGLTGWKKTTLTSVVSSHFIKKVYGRWFIDGCFDLGLNSLDGTIFGNNWTLVASFSKTSYSLDCFYIDKIGFIFIMPGIVAIGKLDGMDSQKIANNYKWSLTTIVEFQTMNSAIIKDTDNIFIITDSAIINFSISTLKRTTMLNTGGKKLFCENNRYYAGTTKGIYYFNENSLSWEKTEGIDSEVFDVNYQNGILMAATYSGIYTSETKEVSL